LYWFRTRKGFDGQVILFYFCLAGLVRFVVEFFRSPLDYRGPVFFGWMPLTQLMALGLFLVAGGLLLFWSCRSQPQPPGPS
jgi:prolipoprotein diacylglyceryltransferase